MTKSKRESGIEGMPQALRMTAFYRVSQSHPLTGWERIQFNWDEKIHQQSDFSFLCSLVGNVVGGPLPKNANGNGIF